MCHPNRDRCDQQNNHRTHFSECRPSVTTATSDVTLFDSAVRVSVTVVATVQCCPETHITEHAEHRLELKRILHTTAQRAQETELSFCHVRFLIPKLPHKSSTLNQKHISCLTGNLIRLKLDPRRVSQKPVSKVKLPQTSCRDLRHRTQLASHRGGQSRTQHKSDFTSRAKPRTSSALEG